MHRRLSGLTLAAWSFGFACVHVVWALGWRWGVPADSPPIADRPWFLMYDVVAGMLMFIAAAVAVLLARGGLPHRTRRLLAIATLIGSILALGRGVPALAWDVTAGEFSGVGFGADVWFTVAGLLGLALWHAVRRPSSHEAHLSRLGPLGRAGQAPGAGPARPSVTSRSDGLKSDGARPRHR